MWDALNSAEIGILDAIQNIFGCGALDVAMPIITLMGEGGYLFIAIALLFLCFKRTRGAGVSMCIALLLGLFIGNMTLKPLFSRMRPYNFNPNFDINSLLVEPLSDRSFPSGHTMCTFEGCVVLFLTQKRYIGIPALCACTLVAFSRLYLYVHYPSDVIAGAILGTLFAIIGVSAVKALRARSELIRNIM